MAFSSADKKWFKESMYDLMLDFHENVTTPTIKAVVQESEERIMNDLGGRLDKVEERLDGVEEKVDNLGKKFDVMRDEINSTQDAQDKQLERLEEAVNLTA